MRQSAAIDGGRRAARRVLHLDFSTADLPPPLQWAVDVEPAGI